MSIRYAFSTTTIINFGTITIKSKIVCFTALSFTFIIASVTHLYFVIE